MDIMPFGSSYRVTRTEVGNVGGTRYLVAEAKVNPRRYHVREIADPVDVRSPLHGRPILYVDKYGSDPDQPKRVLVYARHRANQEIFFRFINTFLEVESATFRELRDRAYPAVMNLGGELKSVSLGLPFDLTRSAMKRLNFFRLSVPIGDIAIEFVPTTAATSQIASVGDRKLPFVAEKPLLGCDLSQTHVLAAVLANLHWASGDIPVNILQDLIAEFSGHLVGA
jgi:hypothetical protein